MDSIRACSRNAQFVAHYCERGTTVLFTVLSTIDLFASRIVHLLFFPSAISALVTHRRADPSSCRRKIALMSDRKWQTREGQQKRKKLVSKGKLISSHFVSTRSQPSSVLPLPLFYIGYSRFFVHHPFSRASSPAPSILTQLPWKSRQRPRLHCRTQ